MAFWDSIVDRMRRALGFEVPSVPPPIPPPIVDWVGFTWTITFIGTRNVRKQYKIIHRNTETGETLTLPRGRPGEMLKGKLDEWQQTGSYEKLRVEVLRRIEGHFSSVCRAADYDKMRSGELTIVPESYMELINMLDIESRKRRESDEKRGVPRVSQSKIYDFNFLFDADKNILGDRFQRVKVERERSEAGTIKFPELRQVPQEVGSWSIAQPLKEPDKIPVFVDLVDRTYGSEIFSMRATLPKDWVMLTRGEVAEFVIRGE